MAALTNLQITTLTFFRYPTLTKKIWAFGMMQRGHALLQGIKGLQCYKLLGTGKEEGFNPLPNWSVYGLLLVWDREEDALLFFQDSKLMQTYRQKASEIWTIFLKNIISRGSWSGTNPFQPNEALDPENPRLAVLTRATIRLSKLWAFWRFVPTSHRPLLQNPGLLFSKGVGEVPIRQNATFTIWKDAAALKDYAYKSPEHLQAMRRTRSEGWYSEELFARFQPYRSLGSWTGQAPL